MEYSLKLQLNSKFQQRMKYSLKLQVHYCKFQQGMQYSLKLQLYSKFQSPSSMSKLQV